MCERGLKSSGPIQMSDIHQTFNQMLERAAKLLEQLFIQRWNACHPKWGWNQYSGRMLMPHLRGTFPIQESLVMTAVIENWDLSLFCNLFLISSGWDHNRVGIPLKMRYITFELSETE